MTDSSCNVVPFKRRLVEGPAYDMTFWRDLAFKSEDAGDTLTAINYWRAALAAANRLASSVEVEANVLWLRSRLNLATEHAQTLMGTTAKDYH